MHYLVGYFCFMDWYETFYQPLAGSDFTILVIALYVVRRIS